jgi:hypothetical protein
MTISCIVGIYSSDKTLELMKCWHKLEHNQKVGWRNCKQWWNDGATKTQSNPKANQKYYGKMVLQNLGAKVEN